MIVRDDNGRKIVMYIVNVIYPLNRYLYLRLFINHTFSVYFVCIRVNYLKKSVESFSIILCRNIYLALRGIFFPYYFSLWFNFSN